MVTWLSLRFLSELVLTSTSLAWSLTASSPSKTMCMVLLPVSLRHGHLCVTSLLFCICSPNLWVLFSGLGASAVECHLQLLQRQVHSVGRLCPDQIFLSLSHRRRVAWLSMLYKLNSNSNHCLFSQLSSAPTRVRHTWAAVAAHPLEFEVSMCRTS